MQRKKKIQSECNFIGLKNNKLYYKCKECNKKSLKSINGSNKKFPSMYHKNIESSYLMHLDANNFYEWAMSKKLPIDGFKWVEHLSKLNESFTKNYDENSNKGYFLEVDVD